MDSIIDTSDLGFAGSLPAIKCGERIVRNGKSYTAIKDVMQSDLVKIEGDIDSSEWNSFFRESN